RARGVGGGGRGASGGGGAGKEKDRRSDDAGARLSAARPVRRPAVPAHRRGHDPRGGGPGLVRAAAGREGRGAGGGGYPPSRTLGPLSHSKCAINGGRLSHSRQRPP